ncbi:MAG: hypothetical protein K0Q94_2874 [Paenibacillus sp.]|nr:hypothetical protein [Paenibacillus sp.]
MMNVAVFSAEPLDFEPVGGMKAFSLEQLDSESLELYGAVLLIGTPRLEEETILSHENVRRLWNYVESGGKLYAEMIGAFDFPSSRLFGWKQDFPKTRRTLEKLRMCEAKEGVPAGSLLEWEGSMAAGFPIYTERWLEYGPYRQTHIADSRGEQVHPGLFIRELGQGLCVYAAFSLLSARNKRALRPYGRWALVISALSERTGIPFRVWGREIAASGGTEPAKAVAASVDWFANSGMLPARDGSAGLYENIHSVTAALSRDRRPDCHAHAALFFHLYGQYSGDGYGETVSRNLMEYLFANGYQETSPESPSQGFFKWYDFPAEQPDQMFTDDNAWVCFVLLYLYRKTGVEEYKRRGLMTAQALLATQNPDTGLRPNVLTGSQLAAIGRERASRELPPSMNPHFESIAHAAFIQAYLVTGERDYLDTALKGTLYLLAHERELRFMYSRTSGLNRLLLPLGFLAKHDRTGEIAAGLERITDYLLSHKHAAGGIQEADNPDPNRFGKEDAGVFLFNGEGIADQLYTNNFLLMNIWEAWKATDDRKYAELYRSLSEFMCRIQIRSTDRRFNGGWMRAYDMDRDEYFGNNGDTGWGPYCIESGWTNAIASAGLLLGLMNESLFE